MACTVSLPHSCADSVDVGPTSDTRFLHAVLAQYTLARGNWSKYNYTPGAPPVAALMPGSVLSKINDVSPEHCCIGCNNASAAAFEAANDGYCLQCVGQHGHCMASFDNECQRTEVQAAINPFCADGSCSFIKMIDGGCGDTCGVNVTRVWCVQTGWSQSTAVDDTGARVNGIGACCAGGGPLPAAFLGSGSGSGAIAGSDAGSDTGSDTGSGSGSSGISDQQLQAWCKPSWNPDDPLGDCEAVMGSICRAEPYRVTRPVTLPDGTVQTLSMHGFLGDPTTSFCGKWYQDALSAEDTVLPTRWGAIQEEILSYCAAAENASAYECSCINFGTNGTGACSGGALAGGTGGVTGDPDADATVPDDANDADGTDGASGGRSNGCMLGTCDGAPAGTAAADCTANGGQLVQGNLIGANTGNAVGLSDYLCLPTCAWTDGLPPDKLIPFDAMFARTKGLCPKDLCMQIVEGTNINVGEFSAGGAIYIDNVTASCGDSPYARVPNASPQIVMAATQNAVVFVNQVSGTCPLGSCGAQATIAFRNPTANALRYAVTKLGTWPAWIDFVNEGVKTGDAHSNAPVEIVFAISDSTQVPVGFTSLGVQVTQVLPDGTTGIAPVSARTTLRIQGIPSDVPRPRGPPPPSPGSLPIEYIPRTPAWVPTALWAGAILVGIVFLFFLAAVVNASTLRRAARERAAAAAGSVGSTGDAGDTGGAVH